ncbi:hypothetical protein HDV02_003291 [Globomyces sp. JEL0801]|nr:hypothetical protein HDV02_003291 [Globomyces sp. JEL0801]
MSFQEIKSSDVGPTPKGIASSSVSPTPKGKPSSDVGPTPNDMLGKVLVILDYPAFDSIVTLTSLALRSLANLKFGMKLKSHLSYQPSTDDKPTRKPTNTNTNVNVFQTMKTNPQSLMTANDRMAVLGSQR